MKDRIGTIRNLVILLDEALLGLKEFGSEETKDEIAEGVRDELQKAGLYRKLKPNMPNIEVILKNINS